MGFDSPKHICARLTLCISKERMSGAQGDEAGKGSGGDAGVERAPPKSPPAKQESSRGYRKRNLVILVSYILVVVVILTAVYMFAPRGCTKCGSTDGSFTVGVYANNGTYNGTASWILTIGSTSTTFSLHDVKATVADANRAPISPLSGVRLTDLTDANWATYHVLYQKTGQETHIDPGAKIIIDKQAYPGAEVMILTYESPSSSGDICRADLP